MMSYHGGKGNMWQENAGTPCQVNILFPDILTITNISHLNSFSFGKKKNGLIPLNSFIPTWVLRMLDPKHSWEEFFF